MTNRDALAAEIFRTVPEDRLAAAAAMAAMEKRTGTTSATWPELEAFINSLNVRELKLLRKLALALVAQGDSALH
jgi:hypothetical protein